MASDPTAEDRERAKQFIFDTAFLWCQGDLNPIEEIAAQMAADAREQSHAVCNEIEAALREERDSLHTTLAAAEGEAAELRAVVDPALALVYDAFRVGGRNDDFRSIMACHYSEQGEETTCVGYAAVEGYSNLNVRLLAARGVVPLRAIAEACEGIELWPSFAEMLAAYEESADPRQNGE